MAVWPSYAVVLLADYSEQPDAAVESTEMESGPPKVVLTKFKVMVRRPVKVFIKNNMDYEAFKSWFRSDVKRGSLWFDMKDPISGVIRQTRIKDGQISQFSLVGGFNQGWLGSMTLETWE